MDQIISPWERRLRVAVVRRCSSNVMQTFQLAIYNSAGNSFSNRCHPLLMVINQIVCSNIRPYYWLELICLYTDDNNITYKYITLISDQYIPWCGTIQLEWLLCGEREFISEYFICSCFDDIKNTTYFHSSQLVHVIKTNITRRKLSSA